MTELFPYLEKGERMWKTLAPTCSRNYFIVAWRTYIRMWTPANLARSRNRDVDNSATRRETAECCHSTAVSHSLCGIQASKKLELFRGLKYEIRNTSRRSPPHTSLENTNKDHITEIFMYREIERNEFIVHLYVRGAKLDYGTIFAFSQFQMHCVGPPSHSLKWCGAFVRASVVTKCVADALERFTDMGTLVHIDNFLGAAKATSCVFLPLVWHLSTPHRSYRKMRRKSEALHTWDRLRASISRWR